MVIAAVLRGNKTIKCNAVQLNVYVIKVINQAFSFAASEFFHLFNQVEIGWKILEFFLIKVFLDNVG